MSFEGKRVLVTGGGGFIGSHVLDKVIALGAEGVALDNFVGGFRDNVNKQATLIEGDVNDYSTCLKATKDIDVIFHFAAHAAEGQSIFCPIFNAENNILGSVKLLTAAVNNNVEKFVFASSIATYGEPKELPMKETHSQLPEDPYGISKMVFEHYLRVYYDTGAIKPFIARFYNVYGPRQRLDDPYRGVVPIFINKCMKGEQPVIFGDGLQERAFTYIDDVVESAIKLSTRDDLVNTPLNIGSTEPVSVKRLAELIIEKLEANLDIKYVPTRGTDVKVAFCDVEKAKNLLGLECKTNMADGIARTVEWAKIVGVKDFRYTDNIEIDRLAHDVYKKKSI